MNPQLKNNSFESNDPSSELNSQITFCNLSCSSTHSNSESHLHSLHIPSTTTRRRIHSSFIELKKSLGLTEFQRKTQIDSLLKKCKSKAFKTIHEGIKNCFTIKIRRLPQEFITNIKIDFNKKYLNRTIGEIYEENDILSSLDEMKAKGHIREDKQWALDEFLGMTLLNVFEYYVNSTRFISDYKHIAQREGEKFAFLFYFISNVFIMYYTQTKGNRLKCSKGNQECGNVRDNQDSRDIFTIEKLGRGIGEGREGSIDSMDSQHQLNRISNSNPRHHHLIETEEFTPVSIITNEELV